MILLLLLAAQPDNGNLETGSAQNWTLEIGSEVSVGSAFGALAPIEGGYSLFAANQILDPGGGGGAGGGAGAGGGQVTRIQVVTCYFFFEPVTATAQIRARVLADTQPAFPVTVELSGMEFGTVSHIVQPTDFSPLAVPFDGFTLATDVILLQSAPFTATSGCMTLSLLADSFESSSLGVILDAARVDPVEAPAPVAFDECVVHTGRGFEPFRNPPSPDRNDGRLDGGSVQVHTGSFTFSTAECQAVNLGLDFVPAATGLAPCSPCPIVGPFAMPDAANFNLAFYFDSQAGSPSDGVSAYLTPVGRGWTHNYHMTLKPGDGGQLLVTRGARTDHYVPDGPGRWRSTAEDTPGFYNHIVENADGTKTLFWPQGTTETYSPDGRLIEIANRTGQKLTFLYSGGLLATVIDPLGREFTFAYEDGMLATVSDFSGREVVLGRNAQGQLTSITGPVVTGTPTGNDFVLGKAIIFKYDLASSPHPQLRDNVTAVIFPNEVALGGDPRIQVAYVTDPVSPDFDRVTAMTVGGTNAAGFSAGGTIFYSYGDLPGPGEVFQTTVTDRNQNVTEYRINALGNAARVREFTKGLRPAEPPFFETLRQYNADGEMTSQTLPEGNVVNYVFDAANPDRAARGNLLLIEQIPDDRMGDQPFLHTEMTYEPVFQHLHTTTDPRGCACAGGAPGQFTWTYVYDYQEGADVAALAEARGIGVSEMSALLAGMPLNLGDVNGDGITSQTMGNAVQRRAPPIQLGDGTIQIITEEYAFNGFGQQVFGVDGEGNKDVYLYHPAADPDGDGANFLAGPFTTEGYLAEVIFDASTTSKRTETTPPEAISNGFLYNDVGVVIAFRDGRGNTDTRTVNALNQVVRTTTEAPFFYDRDAIYDFNNNGIEERIENRTVLVSAGGDLIIADAPGTPATFINRFRFDILDNTRVTEEDATGSTPAILITTTDRDANENPTTVTRPEGNRFRSAYDERDLLLTHTRGADTPDAATYAYNYDLNGNPTEAIDAQDTDGDGQRERVELPEILARSARK